MRGSVVSSASWSLLQSKARCKGAEMESRLYTGSKFGEQPFTFEHKEWPPLFTSCGLSLPLLMPPLTPLG
jgi:hypothetical protein